MALSTTTTMPGPGPDLPASGTAPRSQVFREREERIAGMLRRATSRRPDGALLAALSSGLLCGDDDQTEVVFSLFMALGREGGDRRRALTSLLALAKMGEPGALSLLAWLGDGSSVDRLSILVRDGNASVRYRMAAIRGTLFVIRARSAHSRDRAVRSLIQALRKASDDTEGGVRYASAFVRAVLGHRDVRGCLERGALEERDPELLRLCLLGIEAIGDAASLPFVWRVWMRHPELRQLADAVSEPLEEDLRRRKVNLLEGPPPEIGERPHTVPPLPNEASQPPARKAAPAAGSTALPEVIVEPVVVSAARG